MPRPDQSALHTLVIPTSVIPLLVPSNMVAEIIKPLPLRPIPDTEDWVQGFVDWRNQPTPVVSFEMMCGRMLTAEAMRMVVFFPLPGRSAKDYIAFLCNENPYSRSVDEFSTVEEEVDIPFVAATLKLDGQLVAVPDFQVLVQRMYGANQA